MDETTEKLIARYYDGELSGAEAQKAKAIIAGSEEAGESLERMSRIGQMIHAMADERADSVSFEGFDKRVMNLVKNEPRPVSVAERMRVFMSEVFHHRKIIWIPVASMTGVAAAAMLFLSVNTVAPKTGIPSSAIGSTWQAGVVQVVPGSEAVLANADQVNGTSYRIASDDGATIGVVWIDE